MQDRIGNSISVNASFGRTVRSAATGSVLRQSVWSRLANRTRIPSAACPATRSRRPRLVGCHCYRTAHGERFLVRAIGRVCQRMAARGTVRRVHGPLVRIAGPSRASAADSIVACSAGSLARTDSQPWAARRSAAHHRATAADQRGVGESRGECGRTAAAIGCHRPAIRARRVDRGGRSDAVKVFSVQWKQVSY